MPLMNLLFLTEIDPFPPTGGEKLRSYGLLKMLSEMDMDVHAITGNASVGHSSNSEFPRIQFYPYNFCYDWDFDKIKSRNKLRWGLRRFIREQELVSLINSILLKNKIDVVFIDYYFYGQYIDLFRKKKIPVIYGTHNAQARLMKQSPMASYKDRLAKWRNYALNLLHEMYYFRKADALIVVSEADRKYHRSFIKNNKIFVIPNFLIESEYNTYLGKKENYVLMTANFWAYQNAVGLEWFLGAIWDRDLWQRTQLLVVGIGSMELYEKSLKDHYNLTNVRIIGEVDNLKPYIANARVSIVPLLHGSGTRLKCLESMALRTQIISTSKGSEGIDHKNSIIIADAPREFKNALLKVLDGHIDFTAEAHQVFREKYSLETNKEVLADIIHAVTGSRNL
jgi:polysaccharide biosynthesis protein PslH